MQINLKDFQAQNIATETYHFTVADMGEGFAFPAPPAAEITLRKTGGALIVSVEANGELEVPCARCGDVFTQPCAAKAEYFVNLEILSAENTEDTEDQLPIRYGVLDGAELARQELLLQLPTIFLCTPECEGLCPMCGTPKKRGCTCQPPLADPRWQKLQELLEEPD